MLSIFQINHEHHIKACRSITALQILAERSAIDLAIRRSLPRSLLDILLLPLAILNFNGSHQLWLQSGRMDAVSMKTFVDELGFHGEVREGVIGGEDVG